MTKTVHLKTNFTAGEISPDLLGRGDTNAYENGALILENVFISPTGGIKRRPGTAYTATLPSYARLMAYEYAADQTYVLAITSTSTSIYLDGNLQIILSSPWTTSQLDQLNSGQSAEALYITHPDVPPKRIMRSTSGIWSITDITWNTSGNLSLQPYYKFASPDVTLFSSQTTGSATLTASAPIFTSAYIGVRLRIRTTECTITGFTNPTTVTATIHGALAATPATTDWKEQAFNTLRGYPVTLSFYQDRLVFGGSKSLVNRLWFSKSGDHFNFDLGTGLDDDSIEFGIFSDQISAVRGLVSGRHLQVFCSGAEYMVTGDPLTPTNIQVKRQTRIGTSTDRSIPPIDIDGATMFINRTRTEIREFLYTDLEQAYRATDVALLTHDMISGAVDQDFDKTRRILFIIRADGTFSTLTLYRTENVTAWTRHITNGAVQSCIAARDRLYLQVLRNGTYILEELRDGIYLDSSITASSITPQTIWTGLSHLNGMTVSVLGDGTHQGTYDVSEGTITLSSAVTTIQIGLPYTHTIQPLPLNPLSIGIAAKKSRLIRLSFKVQDTASLNIDTGQGFKPIPLKNTIPPNVFSGDVAVTGYGWHDNISDSLWKISDNTPLPFKLLSLSTQAQVN